jgi:hypothetical protein
MSEIKFFDMNNHVFLLTLISILIGFFSINGCLLSTEGKNRGEEKMPGSENRFFHEDFRKSISLKGTIVHEIDPSLYDLRDLLVIEDRYIVYGGIKEEYVLHLHDLNERKTISFGKLGEGPGKFIAPTGISYTPNSKQIWAFDIAQRTWNAFGLERILGETTSAFQQAITFESEAISYPQWVSPDSIAYLTVSDQSPSRFFYSDSSGKLIGSLGEMPPRKEGIPPTVQSQAYQALLKVSPNQSIYIATLYADRLQGYDRNGREFLNLRGPEEINPTGSIVDLPGFQTFATNQYSKSGYSQIAITNDYLYLLFSGRNDIMASESADKKILDSWVAFSNEILILSPEGDRLLKLLLDREIKDFYVSKEDRHLYGFDYRNKHIVKYSLDEVNFHD